MNFDRSNKFDLFYKGQVNSIRLKSSVASKWASKIFGGNIFCYYFPLRAYQKRAFFLLYYVFFAVQSESEIRVLQLNL